MNSPKKHIKQRLKLWLIHGKTITHNQAQRMFHTNRLAEYIRRLRHDDNMNIEMTMTQFKDGWYGVYKLVKKEKVNRVKTVLKAA